MLEGVKNGLEVVMGRGKREVRGKLTVFLGAAAGAGKTYAMLQAAHERLAEGLDVVIGWIDTHGRPETEALASGIPRVDSRSRDVSGGTVAEMDLDALIARRPQLALVDVLAHTNLEGSRHTHRCDDIEELLAAGINVYTTLNIQHLESLNDIVAQITGIRVLDTIPDRLLENADQVHLIDIPAEELVQRLQEGKVYAPEMTARALRKFYRPGNLNALRELALRQAAQAVNQRMEEYRRGHGIAGPWPVGERVLACISSSPFGVHVLRRARRMAASLRAELIVAYVETPRVAPQNPKAAESLAQNIRLAEKLGAEIVTLTGQDIANEILALAGERNVTQIVLGKPIRPKWLERFRPSIVDEIIRGSTGMSVHIIPGESAPKEQGVKIRPNPGRKKAMPYVWILLQILTVTVIGRLGGETLGITNIALFYLLPVLYASAKYNIGLSVMASLVGVLALDLFFVPPVHHLSVDDLRYLLSFAVFLIVAITTGTIAQRLQYRVEETRIREHRTRALYNIAREIAAVAELDALAEKVVDYMARTLEGEAILMVEGPNEHLQMLAVSQPLSEMAQDPRELEAANWAFLHDQTTGAGTSTLSGAAGMYVPIKAELQIYGVMGIKLKEAYLTPEQRDLVEAVAGLLALTIGRLKLAAEAQAARNLAESERLRTALFNSISHDLRTPLSSITGAVTSLIEDAELYSKEERSTLLQSIKRGAARMNRVIGNLLDMARLESGFLKLQKDWCDVQDLIGVSLRENAELLAGRPLNVDISPGIPLLRLDFALIEQVLTNLLDNAVKYSLPGSEVGILVTAGDGQVWITIDDQGQGIDPGDEEKVFDKFYRLNSDRHVSGTGLGLSICKAIIEEHGGKIRAENRAAIGAAVTFSIPMDATLPNEIATGEAGESDD